MHQPVIVVVPSLRVAGALAFGMVTTWRRGAGPVMGMDQAIIVEIAAWCSERHGCLRVQNRHGHLRMKLERFHPKPEAAL
jgi:hypothetical protein